MANQICASVLTTTTRRAYIPFISLEVVMLAITLSNKFMVSYGDIQMNMCILTL